MMSLNKVLLESPAGQRLVAELERKAAEKSARAAEEARLVTLRANILRILEKRHGNVPEDLATQLQAVGDQQKLDDLLLLAAVCPGLGAFRAALSGS
jgi:hypothetical protein